MLATVGLRIAAEAISIFALTYSGDMIVLRSVNMYNKTRLGRCADVCYDRDLFLTLD